MAQLQKGTTYTDVAPGKTLTHTNLNAHVDAAILLPGAITEQTAIGAATAADDLVLVSDTSAAAGLRKVALSNLIPASEAGNGLSGGGGSPLAVAVDDSSIEINTDALRVKAGGVTAAMLDQDFPDDVSAATPAPDDVLLFGDTNDSGNIKKATFAATAAALRYTSADLAITAGAILDAAHNLGAMPGIVRCVLVCASGEHGYSVGDEIDTSGTRTFLAGTGVAERPVAFGASATNVFIIGLNGGTPIYAAHKSTGSISTLTTASWRVKLYASL